MTKRFTEIEKWDDPWFHDLPPDMKLFWFYILDRCDHAGIWKVNKKLAEFHIGSKVDWDLIGHHFNNRIDTAKEDYWRIIKFLTFQYGPGMNQGASAQSAIRRIQEKGFDSPSVAPSQPLDSPSVGAKATDKATDTVTVKASVFLERGGAGEKTIPANGFKPPSIVPQRALTPATRRPKPIEVGIHVDFVRQFGAVYASRTGEAFNTTPSILRIAKRMIDTHGLAITVRKAQMLGEACENRDKWFTREEGWAEFTIETLDAKWNRLIFKEKIDPKAKADEDLLRELKKLEEERERTNNTHRR